MRLSVSLLNLITNDLKEKILNSFITHINVVSSDDIIFAFSFYRKEKLLISLNHHLPFISLIESKENVHTLIGKTNDILRKELNGAYLTDILQKENDRVLYLTFFKTNDLYEKEELKLILELIPHRSNLILIKNDVILFATHYTSLDHVHPVIKGMKYEELENSNNQDSEETSLDEFKNWANSYLDEAKEKRRKDQFAPLFSKVKSRIKSLNKKIITLNETIKTANEDLSYKDYGDLIYTTNNDLDLIKEYINDGYLKDYDESLNPNENALRYFKKYKKAKSTIVHANEEILKANDEIKYYERILNQLEMGDDEELLEIKEQLFLNKSNPKAKNNKKMKISPSYIKVGNTIIAFGRTDGQNNILTFEKAKPNHEFFHIANYPGSHVVILKDDPTNEERLIASEICLILSKQESGDIQTTKIKNVKKGDKLGLVNLKSYSLIHLNNVRSSTVKLLENKSKL